MKVSVEVKQGAVTRKLSVTAHSMERALQLAGGYLPGARVLFPVDPEEFFYGGFDAGSPVPENVEPIGRFLEIPNATTEVAA